MTTPTAASEAATPAPPAGTPPAPDPDPKAFARALLASILLGIPVAAAAVLFMTVYHDLGVLLWSDLPDELGLDGPPAWYVILVPALAGVLVALALRLPGHGGHSPADGLSFAMPRPKDLPSIVLAAVASLGFGLVLGPEAPLIALGMGLGLVGARLAGTGQVVAPVVALAGAFAALSTLFGGPLASSLLLFEAVAGAGRFPSERIPRILLPGLVAAGVGTLVFTGIGQWDGVHEASLAVPGLAPYGAVQVADIAWGLVIAVVVAPLVLACRGMGSRLRDRLQERWIGLVACGALVGLVAVLFREITDENVELVLFSGQTAIPKVLPIDDAGVLIAIVAAKAIAYMLSLGAGFRGGPVFPAIFLGVTVGVLAGSVLPDAATTPAVVAGVAAATSAGLRLPFTGALLAALLAGSAGKNAIPIAILAAALAWLIALAFDRARERRAAAAPDVAAAAPQPAG